MFNEMESMFTGCPQKVYRDKKNYNNGKTTLYIGKRNIDVSLGRAECPLYNDVQLVTSLTRMSSDRGACRVNFREWEPFDALWRLSITNTVQGQQHICILVTAISRLKN